MLSPTKVAGEPKPTELAISPSPAPVPGFRHRLLPMESDRTPGDAAPIYLRLHGEFTEGMRLLASVKPQEWFRTPLEKFPTAEARAYVDRFTSRLQQLRYGTLRRTCDWNYTLPEEKDHAYAILLPDAQEMRLWGRLIALRARVEIAEGKLDDAVRTLETGLAFSRHVADGPFLINALIGMAIASEVLGQAEELIARPESPNLYWALTALPRPLIGVRAAFDNETKMIDWLFPELGQVDRPWSPAEWSALLARFHARMATMLDQSGLIEPEQRKSIRFEPDLARFRAALAPEARAYLKAIGVEAGPETPDDRALMLYFAGKIREIRDEWSKPFYLPFPEASPLFASIAKRYAADKEGPFGLFVYLAPAIEAGRAAEVRLDRRVAALRAIEAIRMQAAADGGKFPESADKVVVVPMPLDPSAGKPFEFRRDGDAMILTSAPVYEGRLTFRLTPRK